MLYYIGDPNYRNFLSVAVGVASSSSGKAKAKKTAVNDSTFAYQKLNI